MPTFSQQWGEVSCSVCTGRFDLIRLPCSLTCSHTVCVACLASFRDGTVTKCPLDQTDQKLAVGLLPVNTCLLELLQLDWKNCLTVQERLRICMHVFPEENARRCYLTGLEKLENMATIVATTEALNKPLQRKLMTLFQCQILLEEGRARSLKAARSVCERIVVELILQHQNQQQLTTHLWSAVRARGCQFLGPAMQEEVLKLVLLALESGSALSRKVLVMFIVQKLKPQYPQASKTSVGHVVQLLYRASCFKVCKRDGDSSLMELKEEFRTYDALRREHDAQVIQIAQESGLRIAPEQWSSLLYGDQQHKSPMQSIIDKLQTSQFFAQSIQELLVAIQRSGDPSSLDGLSEPLNYLADLDMNAPESCSIQVISLVLLNILSILVCYLRFMTALQSSRDPVPTARGSRLGDDDFHAMHVEHGGLNGQGYVPVRPAFLRQSLSATRSLPHTTHGNVFSSPDILAESLSVMDLNRTIYRTPENSHASMQMMHNVNRIGAHSPLSFSVGRPATRQHSSPFPRQTSQAVPLSHFPVATSTRLNLPTGLAGQSNFGLSFMTPPTSSPLSELSTDYSSMYQRQPVTASASWSGPGFHSDFRVPQRYPRESEDSRTMPVSLSSGSLLDDYSKWRDDAATSNGIHRISSHSDNMQQLPTSYPQETLSFNQARSSMFFLDERPLHAANSARLRYGAPPAADGQTTVNQQHALLGRR